MGGARAAGGLTERRRSSHRRPPGPLSTAFRGSPTRQQAASRPWAPASDSGEQGLGTSPGNSAPWAPPRHAQDWIGCKRWRPYFASHRGQRARAHPRRDERVARRTATPSSEPRGWCCRLHTRALDASGTTAASRDRHLAHPEHSAKACHAGQALPPRVKEIPWHLQLLSIEAAQIAASLPDTGALSSQPG